jgi:HNH endonuclease
MKKTKDCCVNGCTNQSRAKNMCLKHYYRLKRNGSLSNQKGTRGSLEERFWRYVVKGKKEECWNWTAHLCYGYGVIKGESGKTVLKAHRVSWTIHNGTIPDGMSVLHKCDVRSCVNPHHLWIGTIQDNMKDRDNKQRGARHDGENNPSSKLKERDVLEIVGLLGKGVSQIRIAEMFNVTKGAISAIHTKRAWKDYQLNCVPISTNL